MRGLLLTAALALGAVSMAQPASASAGLGADPGAAIAAAEAAPAMQAQPVYWVWHGRHWNHRRWAPRIRIGGRWVPGHYRYY